MKEIYLNGNNICDLSGLRGLHHLQKLWLCDNQIRSLSAIDGVEFPNVRELWIARNVITKFGTCLDGFWNVGILNVSDNKIGSFKEVLNLGRLEMLSSVCFADPHYGENPVCRLCNYQTYILYHLNQINMLDTLRISNESKQLAEATYMKKKMYYNMRIKTLKRNTTNVVRRSKEAKYSLIQKINQDLKILIKNQKDIEREMHDDGVGGGTKAVFLDQLKSKRKAILAEVDRLREHIAQLKQQSELVKRNVCSISDGSIRRLITELETGGNIRLEDGRPSDLWYTSCVDLITSRFVQSDYRAHGVTGVRVNGVTRIHNRFLRNRFEEKMEATHRSLKRRNGGGGEKGKGSNRKSDGKKKVLEYLFFGEDPEIQNAVGSGNEIKRIIEEGFRMPHEYLSIGVPAAATKLSNSLSHVDVPEVRSQFESASARKRRSSDTVRRRGLC